MGNNCSHLSPRHANAVRPPTEIDAQRCGGQKAAAVARGGARALLLAVGGSLCADGEGGRGAAGL